MQAGAIPPSRQTEDALHAIAAQPSPAQCSPFLAAPAAAALRSALLRPPLPPAAPVAAGACLTAVNLKRLVMPARLRSKRRGGGHKLSASC